MNPEQFPKIDLFPRITRAADFVKRLVHFLPDTPLASHGDHMPNTGAAVMLDQALDAQVQQ